MSKAPKPKPVRTNCDLLPEISRPAPTIQSIHSLTLRIASLRSFRSRCFGLACLVALMATSCGWPLGSEAGTQGSAVADIGTVERVIDGDTVDILIDDQSERVRLIGIDTPESVSRNTPDQCFGAEASAALVGLLPPGTPVQLVRDNEARDRYGRLLLYLYRSSDDLFINNWLVENGFADAVSYRPNTAHEADFTRARDRARSRGLGLWGTCDGPDQPLE